MIARYCLLFCILLPFMLGGCSCNGKDTNPTTSTPAQSSKSIETTKESTVKTDTVYHYKTDIKTDKRVAENGDIIETTKVTPIQTGSTTTHTEKYILNGKEVSKEQFDKAK